MATNQHTRSGRRLTTRRRKTSKWIDIQGRMLTGPQHRQYQAELASWIGRHPGDSLETSQARVADDVLYASRPSVQACKQLESMALYRRGTNALVALGSLKDLKLWTGDAKLVELYNAVIGRVADEYLAIGQELTEIHDAIAAETGKPRP